MRNGTVNILDGLAYSQQKIGVWSWSSILANRLGRELPAGSELLLTESSGHQVPEGSIGCREAYGREGFRGSCAPPCEECRVSDQDSRCVVFLHGRFLRLMDSPPVFHSMNLNERGATSYFGPTLSRKSSNDRFPCASSAQQLTTVHLEQPTIQRNYHACNYSPA